MASVTARKRMIIASWSLAGLVAALAVIDMVIGLPFGGQVVMDAFFILGAGLVAYLAYDAYKDIS